MSLNMQKTVSQLRYDNTWTGKHKIQCYFKHSRMVDEVDSIVQFMISVFGLHTLLRPSKLYSS